MFRKTLLFGVAVLSAGAMLLAAPNVSEAQRGGRGGGVHIGGARVGGVHIGGARVGGYHFGATVGRGFPRGGFHGGSIHPYYHGGYNHAFYHGGYYFHHGLNGYYGGFYPYYSTYGGYYPNFSSYGYYGGYPYGGAYYPYYGGYPYGYQGWNYDPGYSSYPPDYDGGTTQPYRSYGSDALLETSGNSAVVYVHVPLALADVAFDGKLTTTTGKDRVITTPELTPGKTYTYTVTANWTEGGMARNETRAVQVQAGQSATVDFSKNQ
jgi:uncharacterized protein (TIGR03000 family)